MTRRSGLIQQIQEGKEAGKSDSRLARDFHLDRKTIRKYIQMKEPPPKVRTRMRPSEEKLRPYESTIHKQEAEGHTIQLIYENLRAQGYNGSHSAVRIFVAKLRRSRRNEQENKIITRVTRPQLTSYLWQGTEQLSEQKKQDFDYCKQLIPSLKAVESIVQTYRTVMEKKDYPAFLIWLKEQLADIQSPFHSYCRALRIDLAALKNAFELPYSNGLLEGQVNRLKAIKRMMYGRGSLEVLQKRVLYRL